MIHFNKKHIPLYFLIHAALASPFLQAEGISLEEKIKKIRAQRQSAQNIQRKANSMKTSVENLKWMLENSGLDAGDTKELINKVYNELSGASQENLKTMISNLSVAEKSGSSQALNNAVAQQNEIINRFKGIKKTVGLKAKRAQVERLIGQIISRVETSLEKTKAAFEKEANGKSIPSSLKRSLSDDLHQTGDRLELLEEDVDALKEVLQFTGDFTSVSHARIAAEHCSTGNFSKALEEQNNLLKKLGGFLSEISPEEKMEKEEESDSDENFSDNNENQNENLKEISKELEEQLNNIKELEEMQNDGQEISEEELFDETLNALEELKEQLEEQLEQQAEMQEQGEESQEEALKEALEKLEEAIENLSESDPEAAKENMEEALESMDDAQESSDPSESSDSDDEESESDEDGEQEEASTSSQEGDEEQENNENEEENEDEGSSESGESEGGEDEEEGEESEEPEGYKIHEEAISGTGLADEENETPPVGGDGPPKSGGPAGDSEKDSDVKSNGLALKQQGGGEAGAGSKSSKKSNMPKLDIQTTGSAKGSGKKKASSSGESSDSSSDSQDSGQSQGGGGGGGSGQGSGSAKAGQKNEKGNSLELGQKLTGIGAWRRKADPQTKRQLNNAMKSSPPQAYEEKTKAYFKALVDSQDN